MGESREFGEHAWQALTRRHALRLVHQLELAFDIDRIRSEYGVIRERHPFRMHSSAREPGYDVLALVAAGGDPYRDPPGPAPYQKTPVLACAPYLERVLDSFLCDKRRVRLMSLEPQRHIAWHYDRDETLDRGLVRLHLPIEANQAVVSQISHVAYHFGPGELWYGDFGFPHHVDNGGDLRRVHLVIDLVRNAFVDALFGPASIESLTGRDELRESCQRLWRDWSRGEERRSIDGIAPRTTATPPRP
jgi:hypothetical protein